MTRPATPIPVQGCLTFAALLVVSAALADSPARPPTEAKKDKPKQETERDPNEAVRREAEKIVSQLNLEFRKDGEWTKVERIEAPFLFYVHPISHHGKGSLWGWGRKGRPVATLELWQREADRTSWGFAVCNTSGGKLRATQVGAPWWRENESITELKDIPGASAPAAQSGQRLRQMKLLAQKFKAHEFWDPNNSRYELRRLERPACTYQDEAGGILDGGLFIMANENNPEMLLFVEARADPKGGKKPVWQYAVGRTAHAELHLDYDGKEVFSAPSGYEASAPNKPYWLGSFSRTPAIERGKE